MTSAQLQVPGTIIAFTIRVDCTHHFSQESVA